MIDLAFNQSEYLAEFKKALLHEFDSLYKHYYDQNVYAFALVLDEYFIARYATVSTHLSLLSSEENRYQYLPGEDQWNISKWVYRAKTPFNLASFSPQMEKYIQELRLRFITVQSKQHFHQILLDFYIDGMQEIKDRIVQKYCLNAKELIFTIHHCNDQQIAIDSTTLLNPNALHLSESVQGFHDLLNIQLNQKMSRKLSQLDREMLVDLAQILEVDPYDEKVIAQQAYLLTLEPYFLESHPLIQHLINHISSLNQSQLNRDQIQEQIKQLYSV